MKVRPASRSVTVFSKKWQRSHNLVQSFSSTETSLREKSVNRTMEEVFACADKCGALSMRRLIQGSNLSLNEHTGPMPQTSTSTSIRDMVDFLDIWICWVEVVVDAVNKSEAKVGARCWEYGVLVVASTIFVGRNYCDRKSK